MITKLDFTNIQTAVTYNFNTDVAPLTQFDVDVERRVIKDRDRSQQHGVWPTFSYKGGMEIHIEGDLLADDSVDYVTKRLALAAAINGDYDALVADRKDGDLVIAFAGGTEDLTTEVAIDAFSGPIDGGFPAYSKYLVTFFSFNPYFIGTVSGDKYSWT